MLLRIATACPCQQLEDIAHLPAGESELHLAAALSKNSLVLLQAAADSTGRDGQEAVVAIERMGISSRFRASAV